MLIHGWLTLEVEISAGLGIEVDSDECCGRDTAPEGNCPNQCSGF